MCTAITFLSNDFYFGRNLDLEYCYHESVTITPRNFPLVFRNGSKLSTHLAMIGIATVEEDYPLYYDCTNEAGLSMAGLNFPGNAFYAEGSYPQTPIAPFELIPWVLCQCRNVQEAKKLLDTTSIAAIPFSDKFPLSDLHWILSDKHQSITIEPTKSGTTLTSNPVGILTNNPPFEYHLNNLCNYMHMTNKRPDNTLAPRIDLTPYSRGMGAMGLPGDLSSASRFIRACFTKNFSVLHNNEEQAVNQFFHILGAVEQQEGCVRIGDGYEKTIYSSCCNTDKGIYYYTTYENRQITGIDLHRENINGCELVYYPLNRSSEITIEN